MRRTRIRIASLVAALAAVTAGLGVGTGADAVVGGQRSAAGAHRFMASIQDASGFAFCGGSVVADTWVLTAAHCVVGEKPGSLFAVTGRQDLRDTSSGQRLPVTEIRIHPSYRDDTHDVALLRLGSPTASPSIDLATAADDGLEAPGTRVLVAGWGDQLPTLGLFSTNQLQDAELRVVSDADCGDTNVGFDAATGVCAEEFLRDSCQGDSGGPLFAPTARGPVQIGVVSYGTSCALPEFPGVYSEVNSPAIRDWIRASTGV